jgi:hypothetical protein
MENRKILLGMLVITLVFGMTVLGCDEPEDPERPFKGTWNGSYTESGQPAVEAKVTITDTGWTLTVGEGDQEKTLRSGTYTWKKVATIPTASLKVKTDQGTFEIGTGTLAFAVLTFRLNTGTVGAGSGTFKRAKGEPFVGTWNGTFTPTSTGSPVTNASIVLTSSNTWNLTAGAITSNGTYTKSRIGLKVDLDIVTDQGNFPKVGTVLLAPDPSTGKENITVTITTGNAAGKGTFSK